MGKKKLKELYRERANKKRQEAKRLIDGLEEFKKDSTAGAVVEYTHNIYEALRVAGRHLTSAGDTGKAKQYLNLAEKYRGPPKKGLERVMDSRAMAYLAVVFLAAAAFFVSFSLTGNAIGNLTTRNCAWVSTCLFVVGLALAFVYARGKKGKKK